MRGLVTHILHLRKKTIPVLLVSILATIAGCNLNQGKGEQMVNLEKVTDDPEEHLANLNKAISRNKQDASLYKRRAKIFLKKGELDKALADIDEAIKLNKADMANLFLKAQVLRAKGNITQALPLALKAERNSFQSVALYVLLSDLYLQLKQPGNAAIYTKKALALAPKNEFALYYNGRVAEVTGDTAKAATNYKLAIKEAPEFAEARRELTGTLISQRKYEEARQQLDKALKLVPKDGLLWHYRGELYESVQKADSAIWSYNKAITFADSLQQTHYQVGQLLFARNDYAGAISHLEKAGKQYSNNIKYIATLASAYERTGENIKALEQYQRLLEVQPGYTAANYSIARLKAKLMRPVSTYVAEPVSADTLE
jgi:tetratricopeptide (TPR) repeat protein